MLLERADLVTDAGGRDGELLRGLLEAAVPGSCLECMKRGKRRKAAEHG